MIIIRLHHLFNFSSNPVGGRGGKCHDAYRTQGHQNSGYHGLQLTGNRKVEADQVVQE
jgi:hypothetical protein